MRRISTPTAEQDLFGLGKHGFRNGNPSTASLSTRLHAEWFNAIQEELAAVIEGAGIALDPQNNTQLLSALSALKNIQVYSVAGIHVWAVPGKLEKAWVTVIGGGGGGGGATSATGAAGGGGGGGGAAGQKLINLAGVGSVSVTVGAGGLGGIANTTAPVVGGTSSFGAYLSAGGGAAGINSGGGAVIAGAGSGTIFGADISIPGGAGRYSFVNPGISAAGGPGGETLLGRGSYAPNIGGAVTSQQSGFSGSNGSGGSGGAVYNANANGGVGGSGIVIIQW